MAALSVFAVEFVRSTSTSGPLTLVWPDSGTTLKKGMAVSMNGSGQLITAAYGGSATNILGFLAEDAPNSAGTLTKVWVATPDTIYRAVCVTSKNTTTYSQLVGKTVDMQTVSTNFTGLADSAGGVQAIVVDIDPRAVTTSGGDTNQPYFFKILESKCWWTVGR